MPTPLLLAHAHRGRSVRLERDRAEARIVARQGRQVVSVLHATRLPLAEALYLYHEAVRRFVFREPLSAAEAKRCIEAGCREEAALLCEDRLHRCAAHALPVVQARGIA